MRDIKELEHARRPAHARARRPDQPDVRDAVRPRRHVPARGRARRHLRPRRRLRREDRRLRRAGGARRRRASRPTSIHRAASKLAEAIARLEGFKDSKRQLIELRELEDEGDRLARAAISGLFSGGADAITLIRWKDIHEQLEEAVDACENAADVLEAILVKNR